MELSHQQLRLGNLELLSADEKDNYKLNPDHDVLPVGHASRDHGPENDSPGVRLKRGVGAGVDLGEGSRPFVLVERELLQQGGMQLEYATGGGMTICV